MLLALSFFGMPSSLGCHITRLIAATTGSGTLLCGLAPSMDALIAARALAGMGGGG